MSLESGAAVLKYFKKGGLLTAKSAGYLLMGAGLAIVFIVTGIASLSMFFTYKIKNPS